MRHMKKTLSTHSGLANLVLVLILMVETSDSKSILNLLPFWGVLSL